MRRKWSCFQRLNTFFKHAQESASGFVILGELKIKTTANKWQLHAMGEFYSIKGTSTASVRSTHSLKWLWIDVGMLNGVITLENSLASPNVYVCVYVCVNEEFTALVWRAEGNFEKLTFSNHMGLDWSSDLAESALIYWAILGAWGSLRNFKVKLPVNQ